MRPFGRKCGAIALLPGARNTDKKPHRFIFLNHDYPRKKILIGGGNRFVGPVE